MFHKMKLLHIIGNAQTYFDSDKKFGSSKILNFINVFSSKYELIAYSITTIKYIKIPIFF